MHCFQNIRSDEPINPLGVLKLSLRLLMLADEGGSKNPMLQDFSNEETENINSAIEDAILVIRSVFKYGVERSLSGMRVPHSTHL